MVAKMLALLRMTEDAVDVMARTHVRPGALSVDGQHARTYSLDDNVKL